MKVIHTSDWHLGDRLHGWDRTDEEEHFFSQLKSVVARERPDALLVSGDVFDNGTPGNDIAKKFNDALLNISDACPTMETVVIAGNHDSYSRLVVDESLWQRHNVHVFGIPAEDDAGRAVFSRNIVEIAQKGVIAAVPFCHERNFPSVAGAAGASRVQEYFAGMAQFTAEMAQGKPRVLMAHLTVGKETDFTGQDQSMAIGGQECIDPDVLGTGYDYIALGHIHCPQWIKGGRKVARYCGTPRAIHFDETYDHGVDIVEVESGKEPSVRTEVLKPMRDVVTAGGKNGLPFEEALRAVEELDAQSETYIRLNVALGENGAIGPDWAERARRACSSKGYRYCTINPIRKEAAGNAAAARVITVAELKELSNEKVIEILSARHSLTPRQCDLIKKLMEEIDA
ncbi:MAG: exonuclease SbcCD subunit D [Kiritimatiellae bacterium]|nr:exonuclease SbcCD subunit D [Kiritimatiellia bacterium]